MANAHEAESAAVYVTAVDSSLRGRLVALPQASVVLARQVVPLEDLEPTHSCHA